METITIEINKADVYAEVGKSTDYTGSKLIGDDGKARDRILAGDEDLETLSRMWTDTLLAVNDNFKELLVSYNDDGSKYTLTMEVSLSFDKTLAESVASTLRSFFISSIIGQWFKFANKEEASAYIEEAVEFLDTAERMLYSRKKPKRPTT